MKDQMIDSAFSRREFIATTLAAGAAVAGGDLVARRAFADAPATTGTGNELDVMLNINGKDEALHIDPRTSLLDTLREDCGLTGTKKGCDHGQCGACTVLIDGRRVVSCLTLAATVDGTKITTVEGLANADELHPLQAAFIKHDAFQCGFCTPGQLCSAAALLKEGHAKTTDEIREQMSGNICRCGAYPNIVAAIVEVMDVVK